MTAQEEQKKLLDKPESQTVRRKNRAKAEKLFLALIQSSPSSAGRSRLPCRTS
jgi:hypothetical protein